MREIRTYFKGAPFYNAFHRIWPTTEMLLAAALNLFFPGGNFLLQYFEPILHHHDLRDG
jgi:hypothetical protein